MQNLIIKLNLPDLRPTNSLLYGDNEASLRLAKNPELHSRTKHIKLKYHYLRECVTGGKLRTY